jgi:hypothetical protein
MQRELVSLFTNHFSNVTHLRFRGLDVAESFFATMKPALDAAPHLKLLDFTDSSALLNLNDVANLSLPSLLVVVTPTGEPIWFSGSSKRIIYTSKFNMGGASNWASWFSYENNPDYHHLFDPLASDTLDPTWCTRSDPQIGQRMISVGVVSYGNVSAKVVDLGRVTLPILRSGETPTSKFNSDIRVGYPNKQLCSVSFFGGTPNVSVGVNRQAVHSNTTMSVTSLKFWSGNSIMRDAPNWSKLHFEIQPQMCISAICIGFTICISQLVR